MALGGIRPATSAEAVRTQLDVACKGYLCDYLAICRSEYFDPDQAPDVCSAQGDGWHVATPSTTAAATTLTTLAKAARTAAGLPGYGAVIAGKDVGQNRRFVYNAGRFEGMIFSQGSSPQNGFYASWASGQPDNVGPSGTREDCVILVDSYIDGSCFRQYRADPCLGCERPHCDKILDCTNANTEAVQGYWPRCTCRCKPGFAGPKCAHAATATLVLTATLALGQTLTLAHTPTPSHSRTASHTFTVTHSRTIVMATLTPSSTVDYRTLSLNLQTGTLTQSYKSSKSHTVGRTETTFSAVIYRYNISCRGYLCDYLAICSSGNDFYASQGPSVCMAQGEGWHFATVTTLEAASALKAATNASHKMANSQKATAFIAGNDIGQNRSFFFTAGRYANVQFSKGNASSNNFSSLWDKDEPNLGGEDCVFLGPEGLSDVKCKRTEPCLGCERPHCDKILDCTNANTEAVQGYWPRCTCRCKPGFAGTRCGQTVTATITQTSKWSPTPNRIVSRTATYSIRSSGSYTHTVSAEYLSMSMSSSSRESKTVTHSFRSPMRSPSFDLPQSVTTSLLWNDREERAPIVPILVPSATTVALSIAASAVGGITTAVDAQTVAVVGMVSCAGGRRAQKEDMRALSVVAFDSTCEGVLLGNTVVALAVAFLSAVATAVARIILSNRSYKRSTRHCSGATAPNLTNACIMVRTPQLFLSLCVYFMNSYAVCGLRVARGGSSLVPTGAAAFVFPLMLVVSFPLMTFLFGARRLLPVQYAWQPMILSSAGSFFFHFWTLDPSVGSQKAFGCVFGSFRRLGCFWSLVPHFSFLASLPLFLATSASNTCGPLFAVSGGLHFIGALVVVVVRPRRVPIADVLHSATLFVNGLIVSNATVLVYFPEKAGNSASGGALLEQLGTVITVLSVLRVAQSVSILVLDLLVRYNVVGGVYIERPPHNDDANHEMRSSDFELELLEGSEGASQGKKSGKSKTSHTHLNRGCIPDLSWLSLKADDLEYHGRLWPLQGNTVLSAQSKALAHTDDGSGESLILDKLELLFPTLQEEPSDRPTVAKNSIAPPSHELKPYNNKWRETEMFLEEFRTEEELFRLEVAREVAARQIEEIMRQR